jgi:hypothetical protein
MLDGDSHIDTAAARGHEEASEAHLRACANRRIAYVPRDDQGAVQSLSKFPCAKSCSPIGAASMSI